MKTNEQNKQTNTPQDKLPTGKGEKQQQSGTGDKKDQNRLGRDEYEDNQTDSQQITNQDLKTTNKGSKTEQGGGKEKSQQTTNETGEDVTANTPKRKTGTEWVEGMDETDNDMLDETEVDEDADETDKSGNSNKKSRS